MAGQSIDRKKLLLVIVGIGVMLVAAFAFYASSFLAVIDNNRIYEESPDIMIYAEDESYNMAAGETIQIPIILDIDQKNKEVNAQVTIYGGGGSIENFKFAKISPATLPAGFSGHLDRDSIYLPAIIPTDSAGDIVPEGDNYYGERKQETLILSLTSSKNISLGQYEFAPTVFTNAIDGSSVTISSSFAINIVE